MNNKDLEAFDKWFIRQYRYDYNDLVIPESVMPQKEEWQAALEYARSEGPEGSLHEEGDVRRNMTWKESSEMMTSMASSLGKELKKYKKIAKSKTSEVNKLQAENKMLLEALEAIAKDYDRPSDMMKKARKALKEVGDKRTIKTKKRLRSGSTISVILILIVL
jgi:hypothetical protein